MEEIKEVIKPKIGRPRKQVPKVSKPKKPKKPEIGVVKPRVKKDPNAPKKKYVSPIILCECGGKHAQKDLKRHLATRKHRLFLGEELEPLTRNRKSNVNCFLNCKIDDLTLEQREVRREYFRIANIHYRARKKAEQEKEQ
jgi:hypothetical protein